MSWRILQAILTNAIHCSKSFGLPIDNCRTPPPRLAPFQTASQMRPDFLSSSTSCACQPVAPIPVGSKRSQKNSGSDPFWKTTRPSAPPIREPAQSLADQTFQPSNDTRASTTLYKGKLTRVHQRIGILSKTAAALGHNRTLDRGQKYPFWGLYS